MALKNESLKIIIDKLRDRASKLRRQSWVILVIILMSIISGLYFFINSDSITKKEVFEANTGLVLADVGRILSEVKYEISNNLNLDSIQSLHELGIMEVYDNIFTNTFYTRSTVKEIKKIIVDLRRASIGREDKDYLNDLSKKLDSLKSESRLLLPIIDIYTKKSSKLNSALVSRITDLNSRLSTLNNSVTTATDKVSSAILQSTNVIFSSSVIRIGTIVLLIFLVQILVSLYKYNIRLAAYYNGRADALDLLDVDKGLTTKEIYELVSIMTPKEINFGKPSQSPAHGTVELAKEVLKSKETTQNDA